jgi:CheY-like chemotaxis protein
MNPIRTVLLVDDSENDIFLMRAAFQKAEFHWPLQEVHNGAEAIAYLKGEDRYSDRATFPIPTVMLLDLNMPKKNGFDVLTWVRTQADLKRLVVIVLSASVRPEDAERAYDLGANSFLVKPGKMEDFIDMIRCLRDRLQYNQFLDSTKQ